MAKYFSHRRWADKVYNPNIVSKSEKLQEAGIHDVKVSS